MSTGQAGPVSGQFVAAPQIPERFLLVVRHVRFIQFEVARITFLGGVESPIVV